MQAILRQFPDRQTRCQHAMELTARLMQCLTVNGPKYTSVSFQVRPPRGWVPIVFSLFRLLLAASSTCFADPRRAQCQPRK